MGYSNYRNFKQTLKKLGMEEFEVPLFGPFEAVQPSAWLAECLSIAERVPLTNEKSKSERVVSPILTEAALAFEQYVTLYSGEDLTLDPAMDLSGECDFFIAKHPRKSVMQAPVITLVEAKDENMEYGKSQCAAQMYAALLYNKQEGHPVPFVYGCAVTADAWKFLRLTENRLEVDTKTYYLTEIPKILGVFRHIIKVFLAL